MSVDWPPSSREVLHLYMHVQIMTELLHSSHRMMSHPCVRNPLSVALLDTEQKHCKHFFSGRHFFFGRLFFWAPFFSPSLTSMFCHFAFFALCCFFFSLFSLFFAAEKADTGHPKTAVSARRDATETQKQQNYLLKKRDS